jgi:DNA-binding SARP family transcriptional activator
MDRPFPGVHDQPAPVRVFAEPTVPTADPSDGLRSPGPPDPAGLPEVEVRVLGPVDVRGAARPFQRAWTLDLVVYLALHPLGATNEAWATALWPDRLMAAPTLHSTVSAARRSLGRSRRGRDHLPRRHGRLQLAPTVTSDWCHLREAVATSDAAAWRSALSLVRGRPFDGLRSPDWTVLEGFAAEVEEGIVQLAIRLAERHLEAGDGGAAALAARRGLRASPYDERLYRVLLRAADLQGNPAGVESTMSELVRLVAGGEGGRPAVGPLSIPDATEYVHPDTAVLYRSLSRRPAAAARRTFARL